MRRFEIFLVMLLAASAVECGGGNDETASPTAPTPTTTTPPPGGSGSSGPNTGCATPNAPGNLTVTASGSRVTFTWDAVNGASEYLMLIGSSPSSSNVLFTNTSNPAYYWNGAANGTYYGRVQARNSCGNTSASSNEVTVRIPG